MFAGHFGLAAAVKAKDDKTPLWALMVGTQLLDIVFVPLLLTGQETLESVKEGYGGALIHADYTHSLVGASAIALIAGLLAWRVWGRRSGLVIGLMVFSHWLLDLIVHRADLPLLPANWGGLPLLGLGLWNEPVISAMLEGVLIITGLILYSRSAMERAKLSQHGSAVRGRTAAIVMSLLLILALASDVTGIGG